MKYIIFGISLACVAPLVVWLRQNPRMTPKLWILIGALPFIWGAFPRYQIALFGVPAWPGFVQGFDVSILDLLLLAAFFALPRARPKLPFKLVFSFYFGAVLLSAFGAGSSTASLWYVWQLLRIFFAYMVIARACAEPRIANALLQGLAIGVCFEAATVGWQRFVVHYVRSVGTFEHENMLGIAMHLVIFPFFALLLSGEKGWQPKTVPILGAFIDIFTTSRATIGFAGVGFMFLLVLSMLKNWTAHKTRILGAALLVLLILVPVTYRQFSYRFSGISMTDLMGGRSELNEAAALILADHPMGIGANNFVFTSRAQGYGQRADVGFKNEETFPHNIYWTTAAETGYIGVLALFLFLLRPILFAIRSGWRYRKDRRGDLLLGLATSLLIFDIHSYFEWVFFTDQIQYMVAINLGMIAGLVAQLNSTRPQIRGRDHNAPTTTRT